MTKERKPRQSKPDKAPAPAPARSRSGSPIQAYIDPDIRAAMDSYIAEYNSRHDHRASVTSTIEAALKKYLAAEGHWPPPPRP